MKKTLLLLLLFLFVNSVFGQNGFIETVHSTGWNQAIGLTFSSTGKMYVWEKQGKIYTYVGANKTLVLDISEEVGNYGDHGLTGVVLDPDFVMNGYIYLYYMVDRHHLLYYGTSNYNPNANIYHQATIGRVTRYTLDSNNGFNSTLYNTRKILIGESITTGFPIIGGGHSGGGIVFGKDGTLLVGCGDTGVNDESTNATQAYNDGIITAAEQTRFRPLILQSLNGKIVRIDPQTGDGIPSNPFYDSNAPRSSQSRIWATGFRNPFRMSLRPNTGSHNPADANPGTLYVGDVGEVYFEEINAVSSGGKSFGWPNWEGMDYNYQWYTPSYDFITPTKPAIAWQHPPSGNVKTSKNGVVYSIGTSQFQGTAFDGAASIGGTWYTGSSFPSQYQNTYISGNFDYTTSGWLKSFTFDANDGGTKVTDLRTVYGLSYIAYNPVLDAIYYTQYPDKIIKLSYGPLGNNPPIAIINKDKTYGASPLTIQFNGSQSYDPENGSLTYLWNFGDGTATSTAANPLHTYNTGNNTPTQYTVTLTVKDNNNLTNTVTTIVSVNNTPPTITSLSIDDMDFFANVGQTPLSVSAAVNDLEHSGSQLTYQWDVALYHNTHNHPEIPVYTTSINTVLENVPCDGNLYFYKIVLTVTDAAGLSTSRSKSVYPTCCYSVVSLTSPIDNYATGTLKKIESSSTTEAQNIIDSGAKVLYDAKNSILLKPGFQVNSGATFSAYIDGCGNN